MKRTDKNYRIILVMVFHVRTETNDLNYEFIVGFRSWMK